MKSKVRTLWVVIGILPTIMSYGQISINTDASQPDPSAMLDVKSATKGILIPRVNLTSTSSASPVTSPAPGLLIYNTATTGDIIPGYYYWDGTGAWVRVNSANTPVNTVTKTTNGTLLKTDQFVMTSNDITLTLPVVTSADNGLSITVKNAGTNMDITTVQGNGSATIDGQATSTLLPRWRSNTYVARDGNWLIKEKQLRQDNVYDVSAQGSFLTIADAIAFLGDHMTGPSTILLGSGTYPVSATQTINLSYPLSIEGTSFGESTITATTGGGNPAFNCSSECYFKMIKFNGTGAGDDALRFIGNGKYYEVRYCSFTGFKRAVALLGSSEIWVSDINFNDAVTAGVEVAGGSTLKVSKCYFTNCAKGINLVSATNPTVSILSCTFFNTGSQIGINYTPASFAPFNSMFITNNSWNNAGSFMSGFDFTRSDGRDANAIVENNCGLESQKPHCRISVLNNVSTTTTQVNSGTWYKAIWTNPTVHNCKFTMADNRITYQPSSKRDMYITISGDILVDNSSQTISLAVVKNGVSTVRYGETSLWIPTANQPFQWSTVALIPDVSPNDYFELWCSSTTTSKCTSDVLTFRDVNWFTDTR
jgi:hypothetical protein